MGEEGTSHKELTDEGATVTTEVTAAVVTVPAPIEPSAVTEKVKPSAETIACALVSCAQRAIILLACVDADGLGMEENVDGQYTLRVADDDVYRWDSASAPEEADAEAQKKCWISLTNGDQFTYSQQVQGLCEHYEVVELMSELRAAGFPGELEGSKVTFFKQLEDLLAETWPEITGATTGAERPSRRGFVYMDSEERHLHPPDYG
jgi:hypothetical protein